MGDVILNTDWDKLYNKYKKLIYSIISKDEYCYNFRYDIAQDVWIKIFINKDKFKGGNFVAWITTITIRTMADVIRKRNADSNILRTCEIDYTVERTPVNADVFCILDKKELNKKIEKMPELVRDTLKLKLAGYSNGELATVFNTTKNTINQRLSYRAKMYLKKLVAVVIFGVFMGAATAQPFTDSADAANFHPVFNPRDTNTIAPVVYLYPTYVTAKCKIIVKDCASCGQRVVNCYRKNDNEFYTDRALTKKIVFRSGWFWRLVKKELYFFNWYDLDW